MNKKNVVLIGNELNIKVKCNYELKIACWQESDSDYSSYSEIADFGTTIYNGKEEHITSKELCNIIMNLIDKDTVAIVDTYYSYYSLFTQYEDLYLELYKKLLKINNNDMKIFLGRFRMGKQRLEKSIENENRLNKIIENRVYVFADVELEKDNKSVANDIVNEYEKRYFDFVFENLKD